MVISLFPDRTLAPIASQQQSAKRPNLASNADVLLKLVREVEGEPLPSRGARSQGTVACKTGAAPIAPGNARIELVANGISAAPTVSGMADPARGRRADHELLAVWHGKYEAWILKQAGIQMPRKKKSKVTKPSDPCCDWSALNRITVASD
jgi:hypothetical protein